MKRVCVFTGSSPGGRPSYRSTAQALGEVLVEAGITLVYGGGRVGLMGEIADTVLDGGGEVVGVIPQSLVDKEVAHSGLTDLRVVGSMHERKAVMAELADGFIAMPGGLGTLEELFEVVTWAQLGFHRKPCGLLNVEGYFDPLISFLDSAVAERFVKPEHRSMLLVSEDPAGLLEELGDYRPPPTDKWIDREEL